MAHTYCSVLIHFVFSTKGRQRMIAPDVQPRLWAYMGAIARELGIEAVAVGGTEDHGHLVLALPSGVSIAKAMLEIKKGSSRWMHKTIGFKEFAWQEAYGAFS